MNLTKRDVKKAVKDIFGEEYVQIVQLLIDDNGPTEFQIAEKIGNEVNKVRKLLYVLSESNLVKSKRSKDKALNLYVYNWYFIKENIPSLIKNLKEKEIKKIENMLKAEKGHPFYMCCNRCVKMNFEDSTEFEFRCPECGSMMNEHDNSKEIQNLEMQLKKVK